MTSAINFKTIEDQDEENWKDLTDHQRTFLVDLFKKNIQFHNGEMSATMFSRYVKKSMELGVDIDLIPGRIMVEIKKEAGLEYIENNVAIETY